MYHVRTYFTSLLELLDDRVELFSALVRANGKEITNSFDKFEYQPGTLTHKALDVLRDTPVTDIVVSKAELTMPMMNETLSALARLVD